jgi:hypothetical protein
MPLLRAEPACPALDELFALANAMQRGPQK